MSLVSVFLWVLSILRNTKTPTKITAHHWRLIKLMVTWTTWNSHTEFSGLYLRIPKSKVSFRCTPTVSCIIHFISHLIYKSGAPQKVVIPWKKQCQIVTVLPIGGKPQEVVTPWKKQPSTVAVPPGGEPQKVVKHSTKQPPRVADPKSGEPKEVVIFWKKPPRVALPQKVVSPWK